MKPIIAKLGARLALPLMTAATLLATDRASGVGRRSPDFPAGYTGYHTYAEMTADLQSVATQLRRRRDKQHHATAQHRQQLRGPAHLGAQDQRSPEPG